MCKFLGLQAMTEPCISRTSKLLFFFFDARTSKLDLYRLVSFPENQVESVILLFVTLFITLIYTSGRLWPYGCSTLLNLHTFLFRLLVLYFPLPHSVSSNRNLYLAPYSVAYIGNSTVYMNSLLFFVYKFCENTSV